MHHGMLAVSFLKRSRDLPRMYKSHLGEHWHSEGEKYKLKLIRELNKSEGRLTILSSDYLFAMPSPCPKELLEFLQGVLCTASMGIACYIRDPVSYYLSFLQQKLKASRRIIDPCEQFYSVREIYRAWNIDMPSTKLTLHFRQFMPLQHSRKEGESGWSIVDDFWKTFVSSDTGPPRLDQASSRDINLSLSAEAMILLHRFQTNQDPKSDNRYTRPKRLFLQQLINAQNLVSGLTRPVCSRHVARMICSAYRDEFDWIHKNKIVELAYLSDSVLHLSTGRSSNAPPNEKMDLEEILEYYSPNRLRLLEEAVDACDGM